MLNLKIEQENKKLELQARSLMKFKVDLQVMPEQKLSQDKLYLDFEEEELYKLGIKEEMLQDF